MRVEQMRKCRRSVRRAVALDCALQSELWDGVVQLPASNLSTDGIWIETPLPLDLGEELIVSFTPPGASTKVWVAARVVRSSRTRRRSDPAQVPGMGLAFTYCSDAHRRELARALVGQPPRLPRARVPPPLPTPEPAVRSAATIKIGGDANATMQICDDELSVEADEPQVDARAGEREIEAGACAGEREAEAGEQEVEAPARAQTREEPPRSASATVEVRDDEVEHVDDEQAHDPSRVTRMPTRADESVQA